MFLLRDIQKKNKWCSNFWDFETFEFETLKLTLKQGAQRRGQSRDDASVRYYALRRMRALCGADTLHVLIPRLDQRNPAVYEYDWCCGVNVKLSQRSENIEGSINAKQHPCFRNQHPLSHRETHEETTKCLCRREWEKHLASFIWLQQNPDQMHGFIIWNLDQLSPYLSIECLKHNKKTICCVDKAYKYLTRWHVLGQRANIDDAPFSLIHNTARNKAHNFACPRALSSHAIQYQTRECQR